MNSEITCKLHDTHAHLEMLCQRLGLIPEGREDIEMTPQITQSIFDFSQSYLLNHEWVIHPTVSTNNLKYALDLFWEISKIYFLYGSHPEIVDAKFDVNKYLLEQADFLKKILNLPKFKGLLPQDQSNETKPRLIGIGECGLDFNYTQDSEIIKKQKELFISQIELAIRLDLPIEIHTRDAWDDTFELLDEFPSIHGKFLIHCFTGGVTELRKCLDRGGLAAFGGIVTFPKSFELQEALVFCPKENLVLETDLPFLAPVPNRGKACLPVMINDTAKFIATIKNTTPELVWEWSRQNSKKLFKF